MFKNYSFYDQVYIPYSLGSVSGGGGGYFAIAGAPYIGVGRIIFCCAWTGGPYVSNGASRRSIFVSAFKLVLITANVGTANIHRTTSDRKACETLKIKI